MTRIPPQQMSPSAEHYRRVIEAALASGHPQDSFAVETRAAEDLLLGALDPAADLRCLAWSIDPDPDSIPETLLWPAPGHVFLSLRMMMRAGTPVAALLESCASALENGRPLLEDELALMHEIQKLLRAPD